LKNRSSEECSSVYSGGIAVQHAGCNETKAEGRNSSPHRRSLARGADELYISTPAVVSGGHGREALAARRLCGAGLGKKANPIILDGQDDRFWLKRQAEDHMACGCVLIDILERFLGYPEQGCRHVWRQWPFRALDVELAGEPGALGKPDQLGH